MADEYVDKGLYENAFELYHSCLKGIFSNDQDLLRKLTKTSYLKEDYDSTITFGICIKRDREFNKSEEKIALAWSYHHTGNQSKARELFSEMDIQFVNYKNRIEFIKFLIEIADSKRAQEISNIILSEINSMDGAERKSKRSVTREVNDLIT